MSTDAQRQRSKERARLVVSVGFIALGVTLVLHCGCTVPTDPCAVDEHVEAIDACVEENTFGELSREQHDSLVDACTHEVLVDVGCEEPGELVSEGEGEGETEEEPRELE